MTTLTQNPSQNPLTPASVSGNLLTVDRWLKSPLIISEHLADMVVTSEDYFLDKVFRTYSNVPGSVMYDPIELNSLFGDREIEEITPGDEYPILTSQRGEPKIARVKKYGGQIYIPDEARDRNQSWVWDREVIKLGNNLLRQLNVVGVAVLDAAIADSDAVTGGSRTAAATSWADAAALTADNVAPNIMPSADFAAIKKRGYEEKQQIKFNTMIVNPQEDYNLELVYGERVGGKAALLQRFGITNYFVTDQQTAGKVKWLEAGRVGGFGTEKPITTKTWRDEGRDRTDLSTSARPVFWADNRWAIYETSGHAA